MRSKRRFLRYRWSTQSSKALTLAYDEPRGVSEVAREFASQFDNERVWKWYWQPFISEHL
jgi:hypothetical protein